MLRNNQNQLYLPFLLLTIFSFFAVAQEKEVHTYKLPVDYSPIIAKLKEQLPQQLIQMNFPGLAIAMVDGDKLIWAEGFGYTDRTNQTKVTSATLFNLASVSKTYTAMGILTAVEKGLMNLDDPLKKYMPQFTVNSRYGADAADKITFRHLLSHKAGIIGDAPCYWDRKCTFLDHIKSISETWLTALPGQRYSYSNFGIDLVGYALELRAQKPFDKFMKDEVFVPLGMTSSTFSLQEASNHPSLAKGHTQEKTLPLEPTIHIPAGGMFSNVVDMAKFVSFHLGGGRINGKQFIRESLLNEMYTPQFAVKGQLGGYGLGIASEAFRRGRRLFHNGGGGGFNTAQTWIPEYQVGVIVLTNSEHNETLANNTAINVLQPMIEAKYARRDLTKLTEKPVITLETRLLQRLEGTYRPDRNSVIAFKVKEDNLYYVSGATEVKVNPHSPTEFTVGDRKFTFILNESGIPTGVQSFSYGGAAFYPVNDRPSEEPGPNKPEWQAYVGKYWGENDRGNSTSVRIKNGYLYMDWDGKVKLTEDKPGHFFTPDGEIVIFQEEKLWMRGFRVYLKEKPAKSN